MELSSIRFLSLSLYLAHTPSHVSFLIRIDSCMWRSISFFLLITVKHVFSCKFFFSLNAARQKLGLGHAFLLATAIASLPSGRAFVIEGASVNDSAQTNHKIYHGKSQ